MTKMKLPGTTITAELKLYAVCWPGGLTLSARISTSVGEITAEIEPIGTFGAMLKFVDCRGITIVAGAVR